ncbi:unnamed protein product [Lymnaea stagnalis]|uniref:GH18 domain-containing protein n=1 Tax=Lymnaea stagnalis TaxID=6523 RepID=A0AAV2HJT7_LYMST
MPFNAGPEMWHIGKTILLLSAFLCSVYAAKNCRCENEEDCKQQYEKDSQSKEVYVFSNEETDVETWSWNSITTLIVSASFDYNNAAQFKTMCVAHSKKRKFGFTVDMTLNGQINVTSNETLQWIATVKSKQAQWHAEVVAINLLPYFKNDVNSSTKDHENLAVLLKNTKDAVRNGSTSYTIQIACIIPWRPPCSEIEEECDFSKLSTDGCDLFIINPESFTDLDGVKCMARATIPFSKLVYGISEYNAHHIPNKQIILGVPWHGYDYTCQQLTNEVCILDHDEKCHYADRKMMSHADLMSNFSAKYLKSDFNELYNAPYFNYEKNDKQHQVWFENPSSLMNKYRLVHELGLKGIGVMYGDDLVSHLPRKMFFDDQEMWSWVNHEIILQASQKPARNDFHYADTVAGVAVGCLLLGTVLGFLFTCLALRKRVKKPKEPFASDRPSVEEFVDEDPNL